MTQPQRTDPMRWRATFGESYPQELHVASTVPLPETLAGRKVFFGLRGKSLENVSFVACQFYIDRSPAQQPDTDQPQVTTQFEITDLTFRSCHFDRTFLGGVTYLRCRFTDCTFNRCDFGGSKFLDCTFADCLFTDCTAWNTRFRMTVIDPAAFLTGLPFPLRNYQNVDVAARRHDERKHLTTLLEVADQLLGSLANTNQSHYFDRALYYAKLYDFCHRLRRVTEWTRYKRLHLTAKRAAAATLSDASRVAFDGLNLLLTKGGTSFLRLVAIFVVVNTLLFPFLMVPRCSMTYHDDQLFFQNASYLQKSAAGMELFLAFGYTNFKPCNAASHAAIVLYAGLGILWYAFLIPVLLRRIYK